MSDFEPFYDVSRSYEDNYEQGPFGAFAEALKDGNGADAAGTTSEGAWPPFWASRSTCLSAFPQARCSTAVSPRPLSTWVSIWRPTKPCVRAPGAATRSRTCSPYTPSRRTVTDAGQAPNWTKACWQTPTMNSRFPSPTASVCPRRALTSGSRTCAPPSRPPVPVKCWSRASKARV